MHQQETKTAELEKSTEESTEVEEVEATGSTNATDQKDEAPSAKVDEEPNVDEQQYPSRTPLAGGWAGGEVGLKQFVQVLRLH